VEYQIGFEHFQFISITSLNTIKEYEKGFEEVLSTYEIELKKTIDYKL